MARDTLYVRSRTGAAYRRAGRIWTPEWEAVATSDLGPDGVALVCADHGLQAQFEPPAKLAPAKGDSSASELAAMRSELDRADQLYKLAAGELSRVAEQLDAQQRECARHSGELIAVGSELQAAKASLAEAEKKHADCALELAECRAELAKAQAEAKELRDLVESASAPPAATAPPEPAPEPAATAKSKK